MSERNVHLMWKYWQNFSFAFLTLTSIPRHSSIVILANASIYQPVSRPVKPLGCCLALNAHYQLKFLHQIENDRCLEFDYELFSLEMLLLKPAENVKRAPIRSNDGDMSWLRNFKHTGAPEWVGENRLTHTSVLLTWHPKLYISLKLFLTLSFSLTLSTR